MMDNDMLGRGSRLSMSYLHLALFQLFIFSCSIVGMLTPGQTYNVHSNLAAAPARALRMDIPLSIPSMSSKIAIHSPITTYKSSMLEVPCGVSMPSMRATKRNLLTPAVLPMGASVPRGIFTCHYPRIHCTLTPCETLFYGPRLDILPMRGSRRNVPTA
jgi:hypothetical protein